MKNLKSDLLVFVFILLIVAIGWQLTDAERVYTAPNSVYPYTITIDNNYQLYPLLVVCSDSDYYPVTHKAPGQNNAVILECIPQ